MNPLEVPQFVRLDQGFLKLLKYLQIKGFLGNQCHSAAGPHRIVEYNLKLAVIRQQRMKSAPRDAIAL